MNKVLLTGRLTRDPELRVLASGKNVTTRLGLPTGTTPEPGRRITGAGTHRLIKQSSRPSRPRWPSQR